ncbi:MAG: SAM-dependent methyltransferase [Lachnospiraceae bacterium]|nr:SAM-dependent methyltransferase [Lachnospiraceae bacterium]
MIQLSKRLKAVADFVTPGKRVADVGTDHGYVPIYLVQSGRTQYALAMDVNKGPLGHAKDNIIKYKLQNHIETRLSNGLREYNKGEAESVVIAGMGGNLMVQILSEAHDKWKADTELVLSPHSETELVRRYLVENNMTIKDESMLIDEGKFYVIMRAVSGRSDYESDVHFRYGKLLLERKDSVLKRYLDRELSKKNLIEDSLKKSASETANDRLRELEEEKKVLSDALSYYE